MKAYTAQRAIRRLALTDAAIRIAHRLAFWAATALVVWSADIVVATVTALPETVFHTIMMTAAAALPAFLLVPCRSSLGLEAVRRIDRKAAIESWLSYRGGPASRMLEARAAEALSVADIVGFGRPRLSKAAHTALLGLAGAGLCLFAASQIISLRAGYGLSLLYPDKSVDAVVVRRSLEANQSQRRYLSPLPLERPAEARDAPGARRSGVPDDQLDEQGARPTFGRPDTRDAMNDTAPAAAGGVAAPQEPGAGAPDRGASTGQPSGSGSRRPADDQHEDRTGSVAQSPGYTGTGRAMSGSPLVDYRARLERLFAESTGTETALGSQPSAETVAQTVRYIFSSFDARVVVGQSDDPATASVLDAWRAAFAAGALR